MKVNGNMNMAKKPSERNAKSIDGFLHAMDKKYGLDTLGDNFFHDYMLFQFSYWEWRYENGDTPFGQVFQIPWIFGSKAIKRWEGKKDFWKKATFAKYKKVKKIDLESFTKIDKRKKPDYININEREEKEKSLFFNTIVGQVHCQMTTTMFNTESEYCLGCKFAQKCKTQLAKTYPGIYLMRKKHERK